MTLDNPREIIRWVINSVDVSDVRGYNAEGKVVCWLDSEKNFETLYENALKMGAPRARFEVKPLDKRPPVFVK